MVLDPRTLRSQPGLLMLIEGTYVVLAVLVASALRFGGVDEAWGVWPELTASTSGFALVVVACLYYWDFYDPYLAISDWDVTARLLSASATASVVLATLTYAMPQLAIGRGILVIGMALATASLLAWRLALARLRRSDERQDRVLILGTGAVARRLAIEVIRRPHLGLKVAGFVGDDPALVGVSIVNPRVVGLTQELPELVRSQRARRVVVALSEYRGCLPVETLLALKLRGTRVHDAASFYEAVTGKIPVEELRPSWLVFSDGFQPSRLTRLAKRLTDVGLAVLGLAVAGPVMSLVWLAVALESAGPALFRQERVGEHGRPFTLYKFRSMRVDAESASGPVWAASNDPRVTRVGRLIRTLRLDELPQLWNVLRGDMSFVGPRPERPHFVEKLTAQIPYYAQRHVVKPGITGWAQVRYPYGNTVEDAVEKLQYDLYYIKRMSIGLDLSVLLQTVKVVLLGRGAV